MLNRDKESTTIIQAPSVTGKLTALIAAGLNAIDNAVPLPQVFLLTIHREMSLSISYRAKEIGKHTGIGIAGISVPSQPLPMKMQFVVATSWVLSGNIIRRRLDPSALSLVHQYRRVF